jgi:hypothetical protein
MTTWDMQIVRARLRLGSGLILFAFVAMHMLAHVVLLISFETADTALALQRALLDRVEALPGVESVTTADWVPLTLSAPTSEVEVDGYVPREHESRDVRRAYVGPGYARTMRIRLAAGR